MLSLDAVPPTLTLKTTPEQFLELTEIEGIVRARYLGRYHWVTLERLDVLPTRELKDLIASSYATVARNLPATPKMQLPVRALRSTKESLRGPGHGRLVDSVPPHGLAS